VFLFWFVPLLSFGALVSIELGKEGFAIGLTGSLSLADANPKT